MKAVVLRGPVPTDRSDCHTLIRDGLAFSLSVTCVAMNALEGIVRHRQVKLMRMQLPNKKGLKLDRS